MGSGDDTLTDSDDPHLLRGEDGDDLIVGAGGADTVQGANGSDSLDGGEGADSVDGGSGSDTLRASANNTVFSLKAISGVETITAGTTTGTCIIRASSDANNFDFSATTLTGITRINMGLGDDTITAFVSGSDKIDLATIDASSAVSGDQAFSFIGTVGFTGAAAQLRYDATDPSKTILMGDINGDGIGDIRIVLTANFALLATDFLL